MEKTITSPNRKIPVLDIPGLGAFQVFHDNEYEMIFNGTRATLLFNADERFFELSERYNSNEPVPVLDFCNVQRQLRAQMYAVKKGNANGRNREERNN